MGNLLKVLTREIENYPHFFLDFENAQPTEGEREIWNQISAVLQDSESILADLQAYKGAGPEIRDAIQNPNDIQLQEKAWNAVCPLVVRLKRFYEFSIRLEKALQSLLESLTCPPYTPTQHLEREQALAKEFAEILHFTLRFDELKMRNPAIQNDFSYYRRTISRNRINNMHVSPWVSWSVHPFSTSSFDCCIRQGPGKRQPSSVIPFPADTVWGFLTLSLSIVSSLLIFIS